MAYIKYMAPDQTILFLHSDNILEINMDDESVSSIIIIVN